MEQIEQLLAALNLQPPRFTQLEVTMRSNIEYVDSEIFLVTKLFKFAITAKLALQIVLAPDIPTYIQFIHDYVIDSTTLSEDIKQWWRDNLRHLMHSHLHWQFYRALIATKNLYSDLTRLREEMIELTTVVNQRVEVLIPQLEIWQRSLEEVSTI